MRASSAIVACGLLVSGCTTKEGVELFMASTYFSNHGHLTKKDANGRHEVGYISTTAALLPLEEHERKHFAALDSWLAERKLCPRGYTRVRHQATVSKGPPLEGASEASDIAARVMQTTVACK
jgi:hypothetical protein